jgi:hypothetical protein
MWGYLRDRFIFQFRYSPGFPPSRERHERHFCWVRPDCTTTHGRIFKDVGFAGKCSCITCTPAIPGGRATCSTQPTTLQSGGDAFIEQRHLKLVAPRCGLITRCLSTSSFPRRRESMGVIPLGSRLRGNDTSATCATCVQTAGRRTVEFSKMLGLQVIESLLPIPGLRDIRTSMFKSLHDGREAQVPRSTAM